jgi:hypothetical protein
VTEGDEKCSIVCHRPARGKEVLLLLLLLLLLQSLPAAPAGVPQARR